MPVNIDLYRAPLRQLVGNGCIRRKRDARNDNVGLVVLTAGALTNDMLDDVYAVCRKIVRALSLNQRDIRRGYRPEIDALISL